jgi:hypothetical protein
VLNISAPPPTNGSGRHRSAVFSGRPRYPPDTPSPPTHMQPTAPMGAGVVSSGSRPSTYTFVFGIGVPIESGTPGVCRCTVFMMLISVGPQQLLNAQ